MSWVAQQITLEQQCMEGDSWVSSALARNPPASPLNEPWFSIGQSSICLSSAALAHCQPPQECMTKRPQMRSQITHLSASAADASAALLEGANTPRPLPLPPTLISSLSPSLVLPSSAAALRHGVMEIARLIKSTQLLHTPNMSGEPCGSSKQQTT